MLSKTLLFVLSVFGLLTSLVFIESKINQIEVNVPKISMYLGSSYHVLFGNPKNEYGLDPGFYHPVFEFTYEKQRTTEDGKYLIPDQATSHQMSTCSFTTEVNSFRGTLTYQEDLKKIAQIHVGSEKYTDFAFSMSRSWDRLQNTTSNQKMSITHASAECQAYQIILDKFTLPELNKDFIEGALQSYQSNDWVDFVEEFGTHYINQLTMGGRATQQISYTFQSVSKMQSLNIDLNITAKASFAKFFADASFDWSKYTKNIEYEQKISTSKKQLYIGGQPPKTGNIYDWQVKIIDNPMPITYKMLPLSELFNKIKDLKFNISQAIEQFNMALQRQCTRIHCRPPTPDFPKPPPAYIVTDKTPLFGNTGGNIFEQYVNSTTMELKRVLMRSGSEIDNIQLFLSDGIAQKYTSAVGGLGGGAATWDVPEDQFINQIQYRSGNRIDSLTFITNKGKKSPKFGGNGGSYHLISIPQDYRIVGFYGVQGSTVYKLGFVLAKTVYPPRQSFSIELDHLNTKKIIQQE